MIVNIFKIIGPRAYIVSTVFSFIVIWFIDFCKKGGQRGLDGLLIVVLFWLGFTLFGLFFTLLLSRKSITKLEGIHLLSFPFVFLFFPQGLDLAGQNILIAFMLVCAKRLFVKSLYFNNQAKLLFDLSIVISIIVLFNIVLSIFYIVPLWVMYDQKQFNGKSLMALLCPVLLIPFTYHGLAVILPTEILAFFDHALEIDIWNLRNAYNAELVWIGILFLSAVVTLFQRPKSHERFAYPERSSGFQFMAFWLIFSLAIGFLGLNIGQGRWLLTYIPAAYFIGVFIENLKTNSLKNTVILLGLIFIVVFKLFDFGVLAI